MSGGFFGSLRKIAEKATVGSWFEKPEDVSPVWEKLSEHKTKCRKTFKDSPKDISMDELFLISSLKTYPVKWDRELVGGFIHQYARMVRTRLQKHAKSLAAKNEETSYFYGGALLPAGDGWKTHVLSDERDEELRAGFQDAKRALVSRSR